MTKPLLAAMMAVAIAAACAASAAGAGSAPSLPDIAAAFRLRAGVHVPVVIAGTSYAAEYVRIEARHGSEYALIFRLRK